MHNFKTHSDLVDKHSYLSPSKYHWVNYTDEELVSSYKKYRAIQRGVELHALAKSCIDNRVPLPKNRKALNQYVNDGIKYRMSTEQGLFFSYNSFGTADAISFSKGLLRVHDLKTGVSKVSIKQLEVYAALFCLEYGYSASEIKMELRIYQDDNMLVENPLPETIEAIMAKIVHSDELIENLKNEGDDLDD